MSRLLTLDGAQRHDPAVERWFSEPRSELRAIALRWFQEMRACGPDVVELIHDRQATACVDNAPFGYVDTFRAHLNVGFFRGAELYDPAKILEGTGRSMRHVKIRPDSTIDEVALQDLILAAYADIKARLSALSSPAELRRQGDWRSPR